MFCRQYSNRAHIARATLEAVCFQTREVLEAMNKDSGVALTTLKVDGGMSVNNLLLQLQADLLGISVGTRNEDDGDESMMVREEVSRRRRKGEEEKQQCMCLQKLIVIFTSLS